MKIIINERQYRRILETITDDNEKNHIGDKVMVYYNDKLPTDLKMLVVSIYINYNSLL